MSEIEKMYENAGIKKKYCGWLDMGDLDCQMQYIICESLKEWEELVFSSRFGKTEEEPELKYPPFTAEKQIELIKLLAKHYGNIHILNNAPRGFAIGIEGVSFNLKKFEEIIAMVLNAFWQDLTPEEKQQVKGILE